MSETTNHACLHNRCRQLRSHWEGISMFKKMILVGAGSAMALGLLFGRDAMSYVATSYGRLHDQVKQNVPIEFELDRAHRMINDLTPEIRSNMHLIAKEEVDVDKLARQVAKLNEGLAQDKREVLRLKADLDDGSQTYQYASHRYSRDQVKADLAGRFERFKTQDATREKLDSILRARQKGLDAARAKLDGMLVAKRQLEVDVENLEARLKMVEVAQTTSSFKFDDSQLSRTEKLLEDIQTRIEVAEKLVSSEGYFADEIQLDEVEVKDVSDEVATYFSSGQDEEIAVDQRVPAIELTSKKSLEPSLN
ncbi:hypothetical protein [Blastopirellula marina]|nr:hypothetical protein [Blastopirellula marina]